MNKTITALPNMIFRLIAEKSRLSNKEIAQAIGGSINTVYNYKCQTPISPKKLAQISENLNVEIRLEENENGVKIIAKGAQDIQ